MLGHAALLPLINRSLPVTTRFRCKAVFYSPNDSRTDVKNSNFLDCSEAEMQIVQSYQYAAEMYASDRVESSWIPVDCVPRLLYFLSYHGATIWAHVLLRLAHFFVTA